MNEKREIWRLAARLLEGHGSNAIKVATQHSRNAREQQETALQEVWEAIANRCEEFLRHAPADDECVH